MCLRDTQKVTQFYNWSNNDINIIFNNSKLNKALHETIVGREVLTGELCAVQMDGGRLRVTFWRSEYEYWVWGVVIRATVTVRAGVERLASGGETHRALSVQNMFCGYGVWHSALKVLCGLHHVCAFSTAQWHRLPVVYDVPHRPYQGADYSINIGTLHWTHGNVISFTPLKICALPCHDVVTFSNSQQRYCQVCCTGSESKRRRNAGSRIEVRLRTSVTAAAMAEPICMDRMFSQSIFVDSSLKDLK